ncbi:MAG: hypothetical protein QM817_18095 [Archangium sp.]
MNGRTLAGALIAVLVAGGVYALWPKEKLSPEDEIRRVVAKMVKAAEKRDPSEVVEPLDENFHGPGGSGKTEVKQILLGQFFRAQSIVVMNPTLEVTVASPTSGHFKGTFVFARDGAAIEASKYEIEADVMKTDGTWKITSAVWNR